MVAVIVRKALRETRQQRAVAVIGSGRLSHGCIIYDALLTHNVSLNFNVCLLHATEI